MYNSDIINNKIKEGRNGNAFSIEIYFSQDFRYNYYSKKSVIQLPSEELFPL